MNEGEPSYHEPQSANESVAGESRFGNKEHILDVLHTHEAHILGSIDEMLPEISAHANVVELVNLLSSGDNTATAEVRPVMIDDEGVPMAGIFKPFDGENEEMRRKSGLPNFYEREEAAYLISEHFDLDLVPPTVVREIDGRLGSLQLFMSSRGYSTVDEGALSDEEWTKISTSPDFVTMGLLDAIIANPDRHENNYLVSKGGADPTKLVAIDHGLILDTSFYEHGLPVRGPVHALTYDNIKKQSRQTLVPLEVLDKLRLGLERKDQLSLSNLSSISPEEVAKMWQRVSEMVDRGYIISRHITE